jgi:Ca-activated chloride channel homolog
MPMYGYQFSEYKAEDATKSIFEQLLQLFQEIILITSGDVGETLSWLTEIDKQHKITTEEYGMADFIKDLERKGYIKTNPKDGKQKFKTTSKTDISLRKRAFEQLFGLLKKSKRGDHSSTKSGKGDESTSDTKPFEFGDNLDNISMTNSIQNAQINHGIDDFMLTDKDLEVNETYFQTQMSTVMMIDISHSMILYGEDRITPAKKVAMALAEYINMKYPKDKLDIIVFGDDAWRIEIKDLPYLTVGPFHTNTVAGLELAMDILKKNRNPNRQIFMITDGKPTCIKKGKKYYKNSFGLDRMIVNRTIALAANCKKQHIPITTFMIATDPYLQQFVEDFTEANNGKAFYSSLDELGDFVFENYKTNRNKRK